MHTPTVLTGDALHVLPKLTNNSVNLVVTSPPYALQRHKLYGGTSEADYPRWLCSIMAAMKPKLTTDGSVLLTIRANLKNGVVSDYVLRTRLALREDGWNECEELIWLKPDGPPLGSRQRPRRTWENILWFSLSNAPHVHLHASGNYTDRIGFYGSKRFRHEVHNSFTSGTKKPKSGNTVSAGTSKVTDTFTALCADIEHGIQHPAMYPVSLCEKLIATFSREGDTVLDPFAGSGTTLVAAQKLHRRAIGIEQNPSYAAIAKTRLRRHRLSDDHPLTLTNGIPNHVKGRKTYLLQQGFERSDALVFEYVLGHTLYAEIPATAAEVSLTDITVGTGLSRSTVQRSLNRLGDGGFIERASTTRHVGSTITLSAAVVRRS